MFKKKKAKNENNMTYFIGGTAVGMAAGLLVGKVLSSTSTVRTQTFEVENSVHKSTNNYTKNIPQCKNENYEGHPKPAVMNSDLKNNINDLTVKKKYDENVLIVSYNNSNNHTLHNISLEDNSKYNLANEILEDYKEEKKYNIHQPPAYNIIKKELYNLKKNTEDKHLVKAVNIKNSNNSNEENTSKEVNICKGIELLEAFDNDNTIYKSPPNVKSSMVHLNILPNYIANASSMATCNDTFLQFEDREENQIFNSTSFDEFNETDLISSTKEIDSENI